MHNISLNQVCYRTLSLENPSSLDTYLKIGGYSSWNKILQEKTSPSELIKKIKDSGLRGRGGAGFLTGVKWGFVDKDYNGQKYLICNSDESEPGTCKDGYILRYNPHQIIEGMAIAGYALGATISYNYMRGEFLEENKSMEKAINEAHNAGLLGKNIKNSGFNFEIYNFLGAGAYICGEESALLDSLEGKRGMPRIKPPFPAQQGLYKKPTVVNNTETLASVPLILENGPEWFANLGTENNGGTKIFCVSGHVNNPGNFEVPLGTKFIDLLNLAGGVRNKRKLKAIIPGGTSMKVLPASSLENLKMDYTSIKSAGSSLGSGGVIVMDESTCMVDTLLNISEFYEDESCGQCTPCREGTGWLVKILIKIKHGTARLSDIDKLVSIADLMEGRTICAFGEAAAWPIQSFVKHFKNEFIRRVKS